jgi:hypothetical protein
VSDPEESYVSCTFWTPNSVFSFCGLTGYI